MPAFSDAICARVFPRNCVWSKLMFVMTERAGDMMFVQSSRPPRPTSTTAMSMPLSAKYLNAKGCCKFKEIWDLEARRNRVPFSQNPRHTLRLCSSHLFLCVHENLSDEGMCTVRPCILGPAILRQWYASMNLCRWFLPRVWSCIWHVGDRNVRPNSTVLYNPSL